MSGYEIEIQSLIMAVMCSIKRRVVVVVEEIEYQIIKYRQTEHMKKKTKTPSRIWFPNKTFFLFTVCSSAVSVLLVQSCFCLLFFRTTHTQDGGKIVALYRWSVPRPTSQPATSHRTGSDLLSVRQPYDDDDDSVCFYN